MQSVRNNVYQGKSTRAEVQSRRSRMLSFDKLTTRKVIVMAVSQELLEILACPACKAKVELKPDGNALKCVECKRVYPIRDDIPVMLIDEATVEA